MSRVENSRQGTVIAGEETAQEVNMFNCLDSVI